MFTINIHQFEIIFTDFITVCFFEKKKKYASILIYNNTGSTQYK